MAGARRRVHDGGVFQQTAKTRRWNSKPHKREFRTSTRESGTSKTGWRGGRGSNSRFGCPKSGELYRNGRLDAFRGETHKVFSTLLGGSNCFLLKAFSISARKHKVAGCAGPCNLTSCGKIPRNGVGRGRCYRLRGGSRVSPPFTTVKRRAGLHAEAGAAKRGSRPT